MNLKELAMALEQIAEEKGIKKEKVVEAVEAALAAAYKKEYRGRSEVIRARIDMKTGELSFWQVKTVVAPDEVRMTEREIEEETASSPKSEAIAKILEGMPEPIRRREENDEDEGEVLPRYNSDRHIFLEEARIIKPDVVSGEEILFPLETHDDFGRIAAQTAKQVVLQGMREAERESIRDEFLGKQGEIVSGTIQRFERGNVFVDLGRTIGVMFYNESIPGEHYKTGQRMRFYVLAVQDEDWSRPGVVLSRAHPDFIKKLFEMEAPEVADGVVEIKDVAREPGSRTKIAVFSHQDSIDPIGAVVGQRGTRVMAVTNELGNEKIDVIAWSEDPEVFVGHSLSPAKVKLVEILPRREAVVLVQEDQLSLAIGKTGQNVRLAAKLTGWKIDVRSQSRPDEIQEGGVAEVKAEDEEGKKVEVLKGETGGEISL